MTARQAQGGFTLIELMVAIVLGMLIVLALTTLFVNISRTNSEMAKTNAQIENGRFAMQLLEGDIVHGGYWGWHVPQFDDMTITGVPDDAPSAVPDPCLAYNATNWTTAYQNNLIAIPIQSYDSAPAGCAVVANKQANTDVLVVRHAQTCLPGVGSCEIDTAGKLYLQPSSCELEIAGGQRYRLNTTGFSTLGTGLHQRNCVGTGSPQALPIVSGTFADKRKFISSIYYIRDYAVTVGDGIPTLVRSQFDLSGATLAHQAAVPLIEGIEGFRVEFGIDSIGDAGTVVDYTKAAAWADPLNRNKLLNRGDGIPDGAFVSCTTAVPCTANQLANVVAVKLYVLARNRESTVSHTDGRTYTLGATTLGPFNDHYKRHVFSTTVRLTNISGRRETP
ncbi:MAG: pilus assembly protein PilW [Betaproteobacteria bacterium CG2_30_59_46]|nr:MAG: pilus assembly protein PilW [Betaproteobacteria bacterium CG2_30_59_46]PIQ13933.1 MAG: pilus assembly protein PilW [Hydrogenophilales bacterium CG18_big_fil_WC_8_21_14_2_50_58_12]PIY00671.1 MAG: pilus assembly protein PilW [Hydrogenophilales bacterium CG_4_10_14_3_um_filter_58_23]PJB07089.1 MAG: pilus assembly protein PilW [Hydrogenophilales bacterium CG_4_9_14_3_um_filter_59_35]